MGADAVSSQLAIDFDALRQRAKAKRDHGKVIAAANNRHQRTRARLAALQCLGTRGPGTISHLRVWCAEQKLELEWAKPWTGSLFQHPWFEPTGELENAFHEGSNARRVMVWRLTEEGHRAFRGAKEQGE